MIKDMLRWAVLTLSSLNHLKSRSKRSWTVNTHILSQLITKQGDWKMVTHMISSTMYLGQMSLLPKLKSTWPDQVKKK